MSSKYYSGQGRLFCAKIVANVAGAFEYMGNAPSYKFDAKTKIAAHQESVSGQRLTDGRFEQGTDATVTIELDEFTPANLRRFLRAKSTDIAAGTVTDEVLPAALKAGDYVALKNINVSAVVIKDSAGVPATLVEGVNYTLNPKHGTIQIVDLGAFVQPLKADYANGPATQIGMFTDKKCAYVLRFEGINTANDDAPTLTEFYKVEFDPSGIDLISDNVTKFTLNGTALYDDTKPIDGDLGRFGRVVMA